MSVFTHCRSVQYVSADANVPAFAMPVFILGKLARSGEISSANLFSADFGPKDAGSMTKTEKGQNARNTFLASADARECETLCSYAPDTFILPLSTYLTDAIIRWPITYRYHINKCDQSCAYAYPADVPPFQRTSLNILQTMQWIHGSRQEGHGTRGLHPGKGTLSSDDARLFLKSSFLQAPWRVVHRRRHPG